MQSHFLLQLLIDCRCQWDRKWRKNWNIWRRKTYALPKIWLVVVPKSNGKVRICVDLTKLNESIWCENFPLPSTDQLLAQLSGDKVFDWLIDDHLYSTILRSLEQTHCARLWFYMSDKLFIARFFEYPPKWCTYSAGMAGATWNCSHLGTSSVYAIQPCTMSLHAKPHM